MGFNCCYNFLPFCVTLLHRHFDKGKQDLCIFISKQLSSQNILLCFNLHDFKISTAYDLPHQLHRFYDFEFKSTTLIRDLQFHFNRIKFSKNCFTAIASSSEFLIASFLELYLLGTSLAQFHISVLCFGNCMCCTFNYFIFASVLDTFLILIRLHLITLEKT